MRSFATANKWALMCFRQKCLTGDPREPQMCIPKGVNPDAL